MLAFRLFALVTLPVCMLICIRPAVREERDSVGNYRRGRVSCHIARERGGVAGPTRRVGRVAVVVAQDVHRVLRGHRESARAIQSRSGVRSQRYVAQRTIH